MSGGHFDYKEYVLDDFADKIECLIESNGSNVRDQWGDPIGRHYAPDIIEVFKAAIVALRRARAYVHRIDYLVSGDDSEENFERALDDDLAKLQR